jgi:hypothetical protein
VRDIAEILEHWQAGRSIRAMAARLGASRPTGRKYISIAEAHGYRPGQLPPAMGWKASWLSRSIGPGGAVQGVRRTSIAA